MTGRKGLTRNGITVAVEHFCFVCGDKATADKFLKLFNEYDWREAKECLTMSWERD